MNGGEPCGAGEALLGYVHGLLGKRADAAGEQQFYDGEVALMASGVERGPSVPIDEVDVDGGLHRHQVLYNVGLAGFHCRMEDGAPQAIAFMEKVGHLLEQFLDLLEGAFANEGVDEGHLLLPLRARHADRVPPAGLSLGLHRQRKKIKWL